MQPLRAKSVIEHIRQNHNRTISERNIAGHIRAFEQQNKRQLMESDLRKFVSGLDVQKMPLTRTGFTILVRKLHENLKGPNVLSHEEIANIASPNSPVGIGKVRALNREIKERLKSRGIVIKRTQPTDPLKSNLPQRVRELITREPSISLKDVFRATGTTVNGFNAAMKRFKTSFRKIQQKVLDERVKELGTKVKPGTNRYYTAAEIAEELGINVRNVVERRTRVAPRGKSSGTAAQIEAVAKEALIWTSLITQELEKNSSRVISSTELVRLTQSNPLTMQAALKKLKQEGEIKEIDTKYPDLVFTPKKGERYFVVTRKGVADRLTNGRKVETRQNTLGKLTIPKIDKMLAQLQALRETRLYSVSPRVTQILQEERKRLLQKKIGLI